MKRVLLIDDDSWQVDHFGRQLEQNGFQVSRAAHALAAIDSIDREKPDVAVLDMLMPGPNGMTLLHELQSHVDLADIPIIVCSSLQLDLNKLSPYGVVAVLDKSTMSRNDLVAAVKKATEHGH